MLSLLTLLRLLLVAVISLCVCVCLCVSGGGQEIGAETESGADGSPFGARESGLGGGGGG